MNPFQPTIVNQLAVKIGNFPLPPTLAAMLTTCWVESSVNLPSAFHLSFRGSSDLLMKTYPHYFRLGAKVSMEAVTSSERHQIFSGVSTGVETEWDHQGAVVLRGLDSSFLMQRQRRAKGYEQMTASSIVRKLAAEDGVHIGSIESTRVKYEFISQANISDWEFVKQLASRNNMMAYFDNEGRLQFRKPGTEVGIPVPLEFEKDVLYCRTGITASDQVSMVTSRGWDQKRKRELTGKAPATTSTQYHIGTSPATVMAAGLGKASSLTETTTPYDSQQEVSEAAAALASDITSAFAELEIEVLPGNGKLIPGATVNLNGAGDTFDGIYIVDATRHELDASNNYSTRVWMTGRQARTVYALAAGGAQREPRVPGVVNAIVTDANDPLTLGRVKLKFPWFDDNYQTGWTRVVQFGGHRGGGVVNPEVNDEVLVAFDRGSFDHPYVLGGLYSQTDKPSKHDTMLYDNRGRLNRKSLVIRDGQRLELLDSTGKKGVRLQSGNKRLTVFLDETHNSISIEDTSPGAGTINIKSPKGTVNVQAGRAVNVKSDATVSIDAASVNIKGTVNIEGATTITGDTRIQGLLTQAGGAANFTGGLVNVAGYVEVVGTLNANLLTQNEVPVT